MPRSETSPRVGLIVETPLSADGMRSEPAVSVPVAAGVIRAARAAAEPPLEPPDDRSSAHGLPTWSGRPAGGELVRVRVSEQHGAGRLEAEPDVARPHRRLDQQPARRGERLPGDGVEVLQPDGNPAQRRRVAARQPLVRARRRRERVLLVDPDPRVDRGGIAVVRVLAVARADPVETGLRQLDGAQLPPREERGGLGDAEIGRVGSSGAKYLRRRLRP